METEIVDRLLYLGEDLVHHAVAVGARVEAPYLGHANSEYYNFYIIFSFPY